MLRDIPGLVVAVPARADDAAPMLRTCLAAAVVDGTVCVFLEPIALYHTRDLYEPGDSGWLRPLRQARGVGGRARRRSARPACTAVGRGLTHHHVRQRRADVAAGGRRLAAEGIGGRVVDLRWLAPLPVADIVREAVATGGRVLVVDETRRTGGVGEGVVTGLVEGGYPGTVRRVTAADSPVPIGPSAEHVVLTEAKVETATRALLAALP